MVNKKITNKKKQKGRMKLVVQKGRMKLEIIMLSKDQKLILIQVLMMNKNLEEF